MNNLLIYYEVIMMKRIVCLLLVLIMLLTTVVFAYDKPISVTLDGEKLTFDVEPALIDGRTMVPIRAIFEAMGAVVEWDNDTQSAICTKGDTVVKMTIDSPTIYINDKASQMDTSPVIINGRTLAPARFVAESFGYKIEWDNENAIAKITSVVSESEKETEETDADDFVVDIYDTSKGSFYMPYEGFYNGEFQPDNESEKIIIKFNAFGYCSKYKNQHEKYLFHGYQIGGSKKVEYDESLKDNVCIYAEFEIENKYSSTEEILNVDDMLGLDNFYWDYGSKINVVYKKYEFRMKTINSLEDHETYVLDDLDGMQIEKGEVAVIKVALITDRTKSAYPFLRVLKDEGKSASYVHIRYDIPRNYKNEEHLKPKAEDVKPQITLSKEECKAKIADLNAEISNKKDEYLDAKYNEKNESKAIDIQNKILALELELKKYENYLKTLE